MRAHPILRPVFVVALLAAACAPRSGMDGSAYVVVFEPNSAGLDAPGQAVVENAAKVARADIDRPVIVASYAAPATITTPAAEFLVSRSRAQAVTNALVNHGIAQSRIVQRPRIATGRDPGSEMRRVEIVLGN